MSISARLFRIKRGFESFIDFFKNTSLNISSFFSNIFYHPKTYQAKQRVSKVSKKMFANIKENKENWKRRTFDDHGFKIEEEDI